MRALLLLLPLLFCLCSGKLIDIQTEEDWNTKVLKSPKPVFVLFTATWCGPCRKYKPIVEAESDSNTDMRFVMVDIEKIEAVTNKFGITGVPHSYIMKNGLAVKDTRGNLDEQQLKDFIKKK